MLLGLASNDSYDSPKSSGPAECAPAADWVRICRLREYRSRFSASQKVARVFQHTSGRLFLAPPSQPLREHQTGSGWICDSESRGWSRGSESTGCSICARRVPIFLNTTEKSILPKLPVLPATGHASGHYYGSVVQAVQGRKFASLKATARTAIVANPSRPAMRCIAAIISPTAA